MLNEKIEDSCDLLYKKSKNFAKFDRPLSTIIIIFMFTMLVGILFFIANTDGISFVDEIKTIIVGVIIITLVLGTYYGLKSKEFRLTDNDQVIVDAYNAYSYLKTYLQKGNKGSDPDDLQNTQNEINSLYYEISRSWKNFAELHPVIPSLETPIGEFVTNISKLKYSLNDKNIEKKDILLILENIIEFLINKEKDDFQVINEKFSALKNMKLPVSKGKKIKSSIKENIQKKSTVYLFITHLVFVGLGAGTILGLDYFKFSPQIQVIAVLPITVTPIMLIWVNKLRKILGTD